MLPSPSVFSAQLISAPTNGTVVLDDDGTFRYTPAAGYTGTDAFVFGFTDGIALGLAMAWTLFITLLLSGWQMNSLVPTNGCGLDCCS
jgi:hypothetical protein